MKTWKVYFVILETKKKNRIEFHVQGFDFWDANKEVLKFIKKNELEVNFCKITEVL